MKAKVRKNRQKFTQMFVEKRKHFPIHSMRPALSAMKSKTKL